MQFFNRIWSLFLIKRGYARTFYYINIYSYGQFLFYSIIIIVIIIFIIIVTFPYPNLLINRTLHKLYYSNEDERKTQTNKDSRLLKFKIRDTNLTAINLPCSSYPKGRWDDLDDTSSFSPSPMHGFPPSSSRSSLPTTSSHNTSPGVLGAQVERGREVLLLKSESPSELLRRSPQLWTGWGICELREFQDLGCASTWRES